MFVFVVHDRSSFGDVTFDPGGGGEIITTIIFLCSDILYTNRFIEKIICSFIDNENNCELRVKADDDTHSVLLLLLFLFLSSNPREQHRAGVSHTYVKLTVRLSNCRL